MVEGLHAVDEGQDQVPDLLLVAVVVPQVDVVGRLVQEDGSLDDLPDEVEHIEVVQAFRPVRFLGSLLSFGSTAR